MVCHRFLTVWRCKQNSLSISLRVFSIVELSLRLGLSTNVYILCKEKNAGELDGAYQNSKLTNFREKLRNFYGHY